MYKKIDEYGIIGNLYSIALIGRDGSMDWLCLPDIDSPSVFGALLDHDKGGQFAVTPSYEWDSVAEYVKDTNILRTRFRTGGGELHLIDFMPILFCGEGELDYQVTQEIYRKIEVKQGKVDIDINYMPRFDYARAETTLSKKNGSIIAKAGDKTLLLTSAVDLDIENDCARAKLCLKKGDTIWFHLQYGVISATDFDENRANKLYDITETYWKTWLDTNESLRKIDAGPYQQMIDRSALVLKLLYYEPTGAIAAAATTSLPEHIGGHRNWDYRYTWIRDASFTIQALVNLGHLSEIHGYLHWLEDMLTENDASKLQIMYGLRGERDLPELELDHLDGYKASRPVRIGNDAAKQSQLDIYGEVMDAALKLSNYVGKIDNKIWPFLRSICDYVVTNWQNKDHGLWEVRSSTQHFVSSKVMCWVALDRGITIARRYGFRADLDIWESARDTIHSDVMEKGWNEKKQSFVQHYETDNLDASSLLISIAGFLPYTHPRVLSTIEAVRKELGDSGNGFLYRYQGNDGLMEVEGTFLLCSFWLIDNLIAQDRLDEAEGLLWKVQTAANHVGLFSEEFDFTWNEALGNFPQAFTHIGFINSVVALRKARGEIQPDSSRDRAHLSRRDLLLTDEIILNGGKPTEDIPTKELVHRLKNEMNTLRGAFFDAQLGTIAYGRMKESEAYKNYVNLSRCLKEMDLRMLESREDKLSFWINLYNVIIIHAIVELDIQDTVKEVREFFQRVHYQIGAMLFSPDDIEHGILRGNARLPHSLFKPFAGSDPRNEFVIKPVDPRIHFTLACGAAFCPPIDIYIPEKLDEQLTIAAEAYLNSGNVMIDKKNKQIHLSRIFKWYDRDFGKTRAERLRLIVSYLYDEEDRIYLEQHTDDIDIHYLDYDWRLNN